MHVTNIASMPPLPAVTFVTLEVARLHHGVRMLQMVSEPG